MICAHGSFVPHGTSGFFFIWAIDPEVHFDPAQRRALSRHPQALPAETLWPVLRGVPYLHEVNCLARVPGPKGPKSQKIPGLALSVPSAVEWILDLEVAFSATQLRPGQSLRAWSAAAKLLLELLGRGRFLPLLRAEAGCLTAEWRLSALEPADATRLAQLEKALPDVCRALVPPGRDHKAYQAPTAETLLGPVPAVGDRFPGPPVSL